MKTRNTPDSGIAAYLLIPLGSAWISLIIRSGMLRMAGLAAICAWMLLSDQLKSANRERS